MTDKYKYRGHKDWVETPKDAEEQAYSDSIALEEAERLEARYSSSPVLYKKMILEAAKKLMTKQDDNEGLDINE